MGMSGRATPVDVSHRIVDSDTAKGIGSSLRDGKERIRMTSGSESWAAAMALKSITGGELGSSALASNLDRASAGTFISPLTCLRSEVYWAMRSRCRA